ncbi:MAG: DnaB-like helicase N-terminal domain-containing protein [Spirochaetota bacterium]
MKYDDIPVEEERLVLGSMLQSPGAAAVAIDLLEPDDFADDLHRELYRDLRHAFKEKKKFSAEKLFERYLNEKTPDERQARIRELIDVIPDVTRTYYYAIKLLEVSLLRKIWKRLISIMLSMRAPGDEHAVASVAARISELHEFIQTRYPFPPMKDEK